MSYVPYWSQYIYFSLAVKCRHEGLCRVQRAADVSSAWHGDRSGDWRIWRIVHLSLPHISSQRSLPMRQETGSAITGGLCLLCSLVEVGTNLPQGAFRDACPLFQDPLLWGPA